MFNRNNHLVHAMNATVSLKIMMYNKIFTILRSKVLLIILYLCIRFMIRYFWKCQNSVEFLPLVNTSNYEVLKPRREKVYTSPMDL